MDRALWLEERRKGIGGSDVAAIMGISPWKTAYQVYQEKRGEVKDWKGTDIMDWGRRMEPAIRQYYSDTTGRSVRLPDKIMYHKEYPFMLASLDGFTDCRRIVEIKTARSGHGWGDPGTNEIPDYYAVQVQHYMLVTGFEVADVPVSIAGGSPVLYEVPANPEVQQLILEACKEFWQRVIDGNPPEPVTYSDAVARFGKVSTVGDVPVTDVDRQRVMDLRSVREKITELETQEEDLKGKLIISLGEKGDALITPEGVPLVTYKMAKGKVSIDTKSLQKEMPEVYAKYMKTGEPSRRFLLK
jgi:putative phage-type endonuclease